MSKTVMITGSSSGIGLDTALYFAEKGWNVVATMREPDKRKTSLHGNPNIDLVHLDVTDPKSIAQTLDYSIQKFGSIDALVNNAGYALMGPFETLDKESILKQYETNVFGLMDMTRAVLPHFRERSSGTIVNITSIGGRTGIPLYSVYNSTKWAVEGFSEALYYEMLPFNIRVKIVEPGFIHTNFYRALDKKDIGEWGAYGEPFSATLKAMDSFPGSLPIVVAKTIYKAASSRSHKLRYPTGSMAKPLMFFKRHLPESWMNGIMQGTMKVKKGARPSGK
jgi:NAD(P)-dependent dehydrogenase (short-subunit alcohol dehydrogenase family)